MFFRDIAGQDIAVGKLRDAIDNNRLPHALLITGPEGTCGLALAWAAAQYILCQHKHDGEPCGECPECIQASKLGHPDLHWVYPLINKGGSGKEASVSEDFLSDWRTALMQNPNLNLQQWIKAQGSDENKQAHIFVSEAGSIIRTLSTKPYESDYRILILWLPEKERLFFFEKFCAMMRLSYSRKLFEMKKWSEEMANLGRERQKGYLQYAQNLIRENYVMNLHQPELNYMKPDEETFSSRFSRFVNAHNVEGIMHELEVAENDVTLNVSSKMIFFDLSLKLIMLLKAGNQG